MAEKIIIDVDFQTNAKKTTTELDDLKAELEGIKGELEDIKKQEKTTGGALKKLSKGFKGMGLAMKAMGVGLIVGAFNLLKDILMKNETVMSAVNVVTETLGVVFNQIVSVVTDIIDAVTKSSEGFEGIQAVIEGLMTIALTPLKLSFYALQLGIQQVQLAYEKWLGGNDEEDIQRITDSINETEKSIQGVTDAAIEASKKVGDNIAEAITEVGNMTKIAVDTATEGIKEISISAAFETGKTLAKAKSQIELLEVLRAKQQFQSQLDAEIQRQIRDDVNKTFDERIAANEELGRVLDDQLEKEQFAANEKVRIALLELDANENNMKLKVAYQQALLEQLDLEERVAGQRSEQLTNETALAIELEEAQNQLALARVSERELEILSLEQDYEAKVELARKAGEDTLAITEQYNEAVIGANEKFAAEDVEIQKKLDDEKAAMQSAQLDVVQNSLKMAGDLFEEGSAAAKTVGVANATIDTWKAVNMALASAPPPLSYISAGLSLTTGLKSIKNILAVKTKKPSKAQAPSDTSLPTSGGSVGSEALADLSGMSSITEQFNNQFGQETPPVQAYVVEQEVTNSQQINTMIQQKATL